MKLEQKYKTTEELFQEYTEQVGFRVRKAEDFTEPVYHYHKYGDTFGINTGVLKLDNHLRWRPGFLYTFSGWPGSGKSEFLNHLMILRAKDGEKIVMYSPESYPVHDLVATLCHGYLGKTINSKFEGHANPSELEEALAFVNEHFFFVDCISCIIFIV